MIFIWLINTIDLSSTYHEDEIVKVFAANLLKCDDDDEDSDDSVKDRHYKLQESSEESFDESVCLRSPTPNKRQKWTKQEEYLLCTEFKMNIENCIFLKTWMPA